MKTMLSDAELHDEHDATKYSPGHGMNDGRVIDLFVLGCSHNHQKG